MIANRLLPPYSPRIVAETDAMLVVDKPPFMQAHPSKPGDRQTLWDWLRELLAYELTTGGQVSLINRLDRETSGLTLVAKTAGAARTLSLAMMRHAIRKCYLAIVHGHPERDAWNCNAPLLRAGTVEQSAIWLRQRAHPEGAPSETRFATVSRFWLGERRFALVAAEPVTGRMHQIRVHLAETGHPIVGDKIYGPSPDCYLEFIETGWTPRLAERLLLPRHALHACELRVEERVYRAPLPEDLQGFLGEAEVGEWDGAD
jgi:23S rRNA pseudouridine1911/1915/1917 synthase